MIDWGAACSRRVAVLGTVARGTYVLVLTAMIVAWTHSLAKEAPAEGQPNQ